MNGYRNVLFPTLVSDAILKSVHKNMVMETPLVIQAEPIS